MVLHLKPSRIEFGIVSSSHVCALLSLLSIRLHNTLLLVSTLFILGSLLAYCFRYSSMAAASLWGKGIKGIEWPMPFGPGLRLMLGQQHGLLQVGVLEVTVDLPRIRYFSEFLIVLGFQPRLTTAASPGSGYRLARAMNVVIWPDSLSRAEDRHLRRYLRFDCPRQTA